MARWFACFVVVCLTASIAYSQEKLQPLDPLTGPPFVTAKAWIAIDLENGKPIDGNESDKPRPMASTTKMMTAWIIGKLAKSDPKIWGEKITFSDRADKTEGSSADIKKGESLSVRELMYGLLLPSGNDAATALAEHFGGRTQVGKVAAKDVDSYTCFIGEMNREGKELGLKNTLFADPHGLSSKGHFSTPHDLAILARAVLSNPDLKKVVSCQAHTTELETPEGKSRKVTWKNTNRLLGTRGYFGVKTGTTSAAGRCLVAAGQRNGDEVILVILGSSSEDSRYADARNLFRWIWLKRGHRN